ACLDNRTNTAIMKSRLDMMHLISFFMPHQPLELSHFGRAANDERGPLVDAGRLDVEDGAGPGGGDAAGLLGEEGDGVGFVEEAELPFGVVSCRRIEEDTPFEDGA